MLSKNIFKFSLATLLSLIGVTHAIQVLPAPQPGIGHNLGKGLSEGFTNGLAIGLAERKRQKALEEQQKQIEAERATLEELLKDYEPSKTPAVVTKILQSKLSPQTKELTINALNEQYKMYLEEQKRSEKGLSWLKKE